MNAIEVLKNNIPKYYDFVRPMKLTKEGKFEPDNSEKEFWDAVKMALLALEQVKRLKECIEYFDAGNYLEENNDFETPEEILIIDIKKVLGGKHE